MYNTFKIGSRQETLVPQPQVMFSVFFLNFERGDEWNFNDQKRSCNELNIYLTSCKSWLNISTKWDYWEYVTNNAIGEIKQNNLAFFTLTLWFHHTSCLTIDVCDWWWPEKSIFISILNFYKCFVSYLGPFWLQKQGKV